MRTLREDGIRKALAGLTTAAEVIDATMSDAD
jgi:type IV pilus assembly protein PilB